MSKIRPLFIILLLTAQSLFAQHISTTDKNELQKKEDSLKTLAVTIIQGRNASDRLNADSQFTKMFVRALKIKNSFYYPFDSLLTISRLIT